MRRRQKHWWNGKWGRIARRDVLLDRDDETGHYWVEAREGGAEGKSMSLEFDCQPDALRYVERITPPSPIDQWREMPTA